jgi:hypothetical protein
MEVNTRHTTSTLPIVGANQRHTTSSFTRPVQMGLFTRVTSYPPLGQITCLQRIQKALRSEKDDAVRMILFRPTLFYRNLILTISPGKIHGRPRIKLSILSPILGSPNLAQHHQRQMDSPSTQRSRFITCAIVDCERRRIQLPSPCIFRGTCPPSHRLPCSLYRAIPEQPRHRMALGQPATSSR